LKRNVKKEEHGTDKFSLGRQMTEDDTFLALTKPSFSELMNLFDIWNFDMSDTRSLKEFCEDNYWTVEKFINLGGNTVIDDTFDINFRFGINRYV
jgi:hypothetical protein